MAEAKPIGTLLFPSRSSNLSAQTEAAFEGLSVWEIGAAVWGRCGVLSLGFFAAVASSHPSTPEVPDLTLRSFRSQGALQSPGGSPDSTATATKGKGKGVTPGGIIRVSLVDSDLGGFVRSPGNFSGGTLRSFARHLFQGNSWLG